MRLCSALVILYQLCYHALVGDILFFFVMEVQARPNCSWQTDWQSNRNARDFYRRNRVFDGGDGGTPWEGSVAS